MVLTSWSQFYKKQGVDLERIRAVALAAAARAGVILRNYWGKTQSVEKKGAINLVTEADLASERAIIHLIRTAFPEHTVVAEESGITLGTDPHEWIIDPLDGTTNYAHSLPEFSVSIAFACEGDPVFGLVLNPVTRELFCGARGQGATLNGRPIRVSRSQRVSESLLVTGFPYEMQPVLRALMSRFERCLMAAQGVRRLGSAALDLCYVACGRFEGFWEQNLAPWDTAAGVVIAQEAGASISDFSNTPYSTKKKEILATNGLIHQELLALLTL
ncbi:MAG: inositol monophosphatase [Desulfobacterales bacterium]|nr:inositol monophosphatase [Desulfobacterales bacterium]